MNARSGATAALARAEAAGLRLALDDAGGVRMRAAAPPPAEVVADLRRHREAVAALLAERARAAFLARAAEDAAAALAVPDPDLAHERAEIAAAQAAEARGEYGRPKPEADHRAALAGFLAAGRQRPPAWAD
ncbi:MAG: hypothetical protein IRY87_36465, partial [Acetobacteraceae bacterium]|nr:hypothetical protein [Acetobacteraceae bacterium]